MATPNPTTDALKAAVENAIQTVKVATELKARLDRAPQPVASEVVKAAAEALVDARWVDTTDAEKVARAIANPTFALQLLTEIAHKSAEKIASLSKAANPRLDAGAVLVPSAKQASAVPVDEASELYHRKMAGYRSAMSK